MSAPVTGLLLCDDLIFASRITGTARAAGLAMKSARGPEEFKSLAQQESPQGVIVDLANPGLDITELIRWLGEQCGTIPRVVAYGSHVDTATLKKARDAGCTVVLPRSKFVEELPAKIKEWLGG